MGRGRYGNRFMSARIRSYAEHIGVLGLCCDSDSAGVGLYCSNTLFALRRNHSWDGLEWRYGMETNDGLHFTEGFS